MPWATHAGNIPHSHISHTQWLPVLPEWESRWTKFNYDYWSWYPMLRMSALFSRIRQEASVEVYHVCVCREWIRNDSRRDDDDDEHRKALSHIPVVSLLHLWSHRSLHLNAWCHHCYHLKSLLPASQTNTIILILISFSHFHVHFIFPFPRMLFFSFSCFTFECQADTNRHTTRTTKQKNTQVSSLTYCHTWEHKQQRITNWLWHTSIHEIIPFSHHLISIMVATTCWRRDHEKKQKKKMNPGVRSPLISCLSYSVIIYCYPHVT